MIAPTPASSFAWTLTGTKPALICLALEPFARHVFTTRQWALGSRADDSGDDQRWGEVAEAVGVEPGHVLRGRQVHGADIVVAGGADTGLRSADIFASAQAETAVAVQAADCVPLLIVDRRTGVVAAAHSGWRGMAARVPAKAVEALAREFGSRSADLLAAFGPSIGACCYEVGEEVRHAFAGAQFTDAELRQWFRDSPAPTERNPSMPGLPRARRPEHWFFDGWSTIRSQLESAGVPAGQIFGAELCTASHPHWFCSYRREGAAAGRLAAAVRRTRPRP